MKKRLLEVAGPISRRGFLEIASASAMVFGSLDSLQGSSAKHAGEPLLDWKLWEKYRNQVVHPTLTIRKENIENAGKNTGKFEWAANYARNIERLADRYLRHISPDNLPKLIEETTPGDPLWTPCPSCRAKGKPVYPHGLWDWSIETPDQITCTICGVVFPNADFPEDIVINTKWGKPQQLSFYGGEPFVVFGFTEGRPSFTANIRSRKVQWAANYARVLAEAFILTDRPEFASGVRSILLRLAGCYPNWLVHVGYGEYADMDPRIAAQNIKNLPEPELTPPPNQPDRQLWTGFWSAGRASGVGLESDFIRKVVEAYDLTCTATDRAGKQLFSESDRVVIEKDLLLESTILLVCDKQINNKSVSNRTAAGLVGLCTGHPGLVRFGLEGFRKATEEWFLPDGTTSESFFYGLMTLGGIWDFAQASKGYSDPQGYRDVDRSRIDKLNLYRSDAYTRVWEGFFNGLQGDLIYPPNADHFLDMGLDASYVELMVANYPDHPQYLDLLKELCGPNLERPSGPAPDRYFEKENTDVTFVGQTLPLDLARPASTSSFSLFYRKPGTEKAANKSLVLRDWNPPSLRIGYMRTGEDGRESLLTLNASHWGGHHESDSLNLYYWKKGAEILSDLGYLWDHPQKWETVMQTFAHNTVLINGREQRKRERDGSMHYFHSDRHVKFMEGSSQAYEETKSYRRSSAIIDHGNGRNYVVDFFLVEGGEYQDYVFHTNISPLKMANLRVDPFSGPQFYRMVNIRKSVGLQTEPWSVSWEASGQIDATAWLIPTAAEEVFIGDGWGQRDWKNSDIGTTIPYIVRRHAGSGPYRFVAVYEGHEKGKPFIRNIAYENGVLVVETLLGRDYIMSAVGTERKEVSKGHILSGHFACISLKNDEISWQFSLPE